MSGSRRATSIVVTGCGTLNALGRDVPSFWDALLEGACGIAPLGARFGAAAGLVAAALPELSGRRRECRALHLALCAAQEAVRQARLDDGLERSRVGVVLGSTAGGILEVEDALAEGGSVPRARLLAFEKSDLVDALAQRFGFEGPRETVSTACASGASAILIGAHMIRAGEADVVLAGGSEALSRITLAGFGALRALDPLPCRPFDRARRGLSLGEGAGMLVLERADAARARGVRVRAVLLGGAQTTDAHHLTAPAEDGAGAARALGAALGSAGRGAEDVGHVNAHGTGTLANDAAEAAALRAVLGRRAARCPVASIKGAIGHTLGAAGAIEAIAAVRTLESGLAPPTVGLTHEDPALGLDLVVGRARRGDFRVVLSCSFGFGGANAVLCLGREDA